ncbi:MAG TPA: BPSL0067 family protein [Edaphobacter sp.]|nr:BPSL0067 family protein [Edaphobacter sp.]
MAAHVVNDPEGCIGKAYANAKGNTECVELIHQMLHSPPTSMWKEGTKVVQGGAAIAKGTAIATFVNGVYPQVGNHGKHAALYLGQDAVGIQVVDQWKSQGMVKKRTIRWTGGPNLSNNGSAFSVIEW